MPALHQPTRRQFVHNTAVAGSALLLSAALPSTAAAASATGPSEDVSPAEDLMREHGALRRILLVYAEAARRLDAAEDLPLPALADAAEVVRSFVEAYHEKLEEDFLFPRLRRANSLTDLVNILLQQHQAGRQLTGDILRLAARSPLPAADRPALSQSLRQFVRMYAPHAAREDTVLFPAFRKLLTAREYDTLGDEFEKKEHDLFGEDGFEKMVDRVASIEKSFGLYDLAQFTPAAARP